MTSTSATTTTAITTTDVTTIVSIINAYATPTDTTINTITATASNITTIITASVTTTNRQTAYRGRIVGLLALFFSLSLSFSLTKPAPRHRSSQFSQIRGEAHDQAALGGAEDHHDIPYGQLINGYNEKLAFKQMAPKEILGREQYRR